MSTIVQLRVKSYFRVNGLPAQRWEVSESAAHPVKQAEVSLLDSRRTVLVKVTTNAFGTANLELKSVADGSYVVLVQAQGAARSQQATHAGTTCSGQVAYRDLELTVTVQKSAIKTVSLTNPKDIHGSGMLSGSALSIDLKPDFWRCKGASRGGKSPDTIIIHHTGTSEMGPALNSFKNGVGPHFVLDIDGFLVMTTECSDSAGHAGTSCWKGVVGVNASTIGIEIIHSTGPYTQAQYDRLLTLIEDLCNTYSIQKHHVIGHQDIATAKHDPKLIDPRRAADPGPDFDWTKLHAKGFGLQLTRPAPAMALMYDGAFAPAVINKPKPPQKLSPKHGTKKAIQELQTDLDLIGYSIQKSGVYDKYTEAAVKHFELHFDGRSSGGMSVGQHTALNIKRCMTW